MAKASPTLTCCPYMRHGKRLICICREDFLWIELLECFLFPWSSSPYGGWKKHLSPLPTKLGSKSSIEDRSVCHKEKIISHHSLPWFPHPQHLQSNKNVLALPVLCPNCSKTREFFNLLDLYLLEFGGGRGSSAEIHNWWSPSLLTP